MKLTDEEIMRMSGSFWFDGQTFSVLGFARALLAAQPDHSGDGGDAWAISDAMRMDEDGRLPQDCDSVKAMVDRFLTWPLPSSVCADKCATDNSYQYPRSGTNLLNAIEAEAMIRHVIGITLPEVGVDERAMENALRYIDGQLTEYLELMPADETSRKLRDCARAALASKAAAVAVREPIAAKAIDADAAARLRLLCKMLGLENAVPTSNEELMDVQFSVFGLMRAKIERLIAPAPIASSEENKT
jgi:hypothetical protein